MTSGKGAGRRRCGIIRTRWRVSPPNAHLVGEIGDLVPGLALDAGCGHGAEAIWLATSGWRVTAVDFSVTALEHARTTAEAVGPDVAERIDWIEGDLGGWEPPPRRFDLVSSLYVHVAGSVSEMVTRLATGVALGGTLLLVGHLPVDPETGEPSPAAGQVQVTVEDAVGPRSTHASGTSSWPRSGPGPGAPESMRSSARCTSPRALDRTHGSGSGGSNGEFDGRDLIPRLRSCLSPPPRPSASPSCTCSSGPRR